jgi:predicted ATPase/class 3 adenylate cyclase
VRAALPTGTVTFLFTDVVGSTRLLHSLGPEAYAEALAGHRRLLRAAFAAHGGAEVDTQGDAFFVAFPTAQEAAAAALDAHAALGEGPVRIRVGLHTGTPTTTDEGYVGIDVHRAARIAALAHAGQTILSEVTAALLDPEPLTDLGRHRLKDFDAPTRLLQLGTAAFPPLRTPGAVALPTPATAFLGRERELHEAVTLVLERDPRVLTILGAGGTGKTRFAIELARLLAEEADGGTLFVPLASVRDLELVLSRIGEALGAGSPEAAAVAARVGERRTRVVLDNLEQLLPQAAPVLAALAEAAPALRLLVTSREAIRIQGEEQLDLPPMIDADAAALFVARARSVGTELERTETVDELCRRLDCLPLAVELAAARTKLLAPEALLERIGARLDLLRGTRDADPRHATLRATITWSVDLLGSAEQELFARLSVFTAGCTLESAIAVCDADLADLESLVDKSLLRRRIGAIGEERLWMLETILELARELLGDDEDATRLRRRHCQRMLEIARSAHLVDDGLSEGPQRHDLVVAERDDMRSALDWATANDARLGLELAVALEAYWVARDPANAARRVGDLLAHAGPLPPELRAAALRVQGGSAYRAGDFELGRRLHEESIAAFRALGDEHRAANLMARLTVDAGYHAEPREARMLAEELRERGRVLGMPRLEAEGLGALATVLRREGDLEGALELARRSAETAASCGFVWWQANMLAEQFELVLGFGQLEEAERTGCGALRLAVAMDERLLKLWMLTGLALVAVERDDLERAGLLWGAVDAEWSIEPLPQDAIFVEFAAPLASLQSARFTAACAAGRELGLEGAIALVLGEDQTLP